jgi:hypothetical protein
MQRITKIAALAVVAVAITANATEAQLVTPTDWKWVTDEPATLIAEGEVIEGKWHFVAMPPGWHVTMGPGGILYDPAFTAEDRFALETEIFLFPGASDAGYGLFFGGANLQGAGRAYIAFLARADGAVGVFRFAGTRVEPVVDWRRNDSTVPLGQEAVKNGLRIEAERDSVAFKVNGTQIVKLPRTSLAMDGHFGLRIGAGLNVHTSNLDLTRRLAPTPRRED